MEVGGAREEEEVGGALDEEMESGAPEDVEQVDDGMSEDVQDAGI